MSKQQETFKKPIFFSKAFCPKLNENRMKSVGDVEQARKFFLKNRPSNLNFLLEKRYEWMNKFISPGAHGIEVGCGAGFSKLFIKQQNFLLTDVSNYEWVDKYVDALQMPFEDSSLDFIISSNMIRHLAQPGIQILHQHYSEFLIFLLSVGVIAKTRTINLPRFIIDKTDNLLIALSKQIFHLQRQIVMKNSKN